MVHYMIRKLSGMTHKYEWPGCGTFHPDIWWHMSSRQEGLEESMRGTGHFLCQSMSDMLRYMVNNYNVCNNKNDKVKQNVVLDAQMLSWLLSSQKQWIIL